MRENLQALTRRLEAEIVNFFVNEVVDERLQEVEITGVQLSSDRRLCIVLFLPPERDPAGGLGAEAAGDTDADDAAEADWAGEGGADEDGADDDLADALAAVLPVVEARAKDTVRQISEVRFKLDRGADNARRVAAILAELKARGELRGEPEPGPEPPR